MAEDPRVINITNSMMNVPHNKTLTLTDQLKSYLLKKMDISNKKIKTLKRKKKIYRSVFVCCTGTNIVLCAIIATLSAATTTYSDVISIFSVVNAVTTGLMATFKIHDKKEKLKIEIRKLKNIQSKLEYVISCNGDLTDEEYNRIIFEIDIIGDNI